MTELSQNRPITRDRRRSSAQGRGYDAAKRTLDIVASLVLILAVAPLLAALWLLVRRGSPGPGLFRQERLGRRMRPFPMLKLRTMYADTSDRVHREYVASLACGDQAPMTGPRGLYKLEADPRVTPLGAWLRRTSLDELPQLFNVLKGEMSLVGPRPVLQWEAELWPSAQPIYTCRFEVKPGITGLWQVGGRGKLTAAESIRLDAEYVRRRNIVLDVVILARTLPALLRGGAALRPSDMPTVLRPIWRNTPVIPQNDLIVTRRESWCTRGFYRHEIRVQIQKTLRGRAAPTRLRRRGMRDIVR